MLVRLMPICSNDSNYFQFLFGGASFFPPIGLLSIQNAKTLQETFTNS
jgi:hypothetical protein